MYKCTCCKAIFDEPGIRYEKVGECHGSPAYEPWAICPECGSDEFERVCDCEICLEPFLEAELDANGLCPECSKTVDDIF